MNGWDRRRKASLSVALAAALLAGGAPANAQNVALLLFDAETSTQFAGCLNCEKYDDAAVCNKYGDFWLEI